MDETAYEYKNGQNILTIRKMDRLRKERSYKNGKSFIQAKKYGSGVFTRAVE